MGFPLFIINSFAKLTIRNRLTLGFGIVLAMMLLLTSIGINNVNFIDDTLTVITEKNSVKQRYAINYRGSVHDRAIAIRDVVLVSNPQEREASVKEIRQLEAFYNESRQPLEQTIASDPSITAQERHIHSKIQAIEAKTLPLVKRVIELTRDDKSGKAKSLLLKEVRPAFTTWLGNINEFIDYQEQENQAQTKLARAGARDFSGIMLLLTSIAGLISLLVIYLIVKSLRLSIGGEPTKVADLLSKLSQGDLTLDIDSKDNSSILHSVKLLQGQLRNIVTNIVSTSKQMNTQTDTVVTGSADILTRVQQQTEYTQNTVEKLQLMQEQIYQISSLLNQTEQNSNQSLNASQEGSQAITTTSVEIKKVSDTVFSAVDQIRKLEQKTQEIGNIANVINSISEQTNLLALNAAIEAARAGESGRGFAVVADEVRTLAQRTGEATAEIESMLKEITKESVASVDAMEQTLPQIENSLTISSQATMLLDNIEVQAKDSLSKVHEVVEASNLQIQAIEELSQNMAEINKMSQSTTTSLGRNSEAGVSLEALAAELNQQVNVFKVK